MKKLIYIMLLFVACKKESDKEGDITFYQTYYSELNGKCDLYVDEINRGKMVKISQMPVCGDNVYQKIITIRLGTGQHTCQIKNGLASPIIKFDVSKGCKQQRAH